MSNITSFLSQSDEQTKYIAKQFYQKLQIGDIVILVGQLGSGKTTFVKGIVESMGIDSQNCPSPTFILAQEFKGDKNVLHIDLYRLNSEQEIEEFFFNEINNYLNSHIIIIEWGEKLLNILQKLKVPFIQVSFEIKDYTSRILRFYNL